MIDVTGKTAAGDEVEGKVTVPEVSHEMIDGHSKYEVSPGSAHRSCQRQAEDG
jgi:hypothetical protein